MKSIKEIIFLFIVWGIYTPVTLYAYTERNLLQNQISESELKSTLLLNQSWVTYPAYEERQEWDKFLGEYKEALIHNGEQLLNYQWKTIPATAYLEFERSGDREIMETPFGENNNALMTFMLAELAEGKGRFTDQLINGVFHSCEMTSWALAAHLITQPTHRALPTPEYQLIDLTAGDLGGLLSWIYYFMHKEFDKIDPEISRRLRHELETRIMEPYLNNDNFWWMAINYKGQMVNNWNPWCNSNALMTFMLMENNVDKLSQAVWKSMQSVDKYLNYVHADGACEEGPSYWGHAAGKALDYLCLLKRITGGRIDTFHEPQIRAMGEYISRSYVGNGWVVNFADASAKGEADASLIYRYGCAVSSPEMKQFASNLAKSKKLSFNGRDIFRSLEAISVNEALKQETTSNQKPDYTWYPDTEVYFQKTKHAFFASKGGYNDESHNHNDIGTFSLWIDNTPFIIDAGVGTYTKQTFSNERYSIWTMQSDFHNLPKINGASQQYGKQFKASRIQASPKHFSLDISTAYPPEAGVKEWIRDYKLNEHTLIITDKFRLTEIKGTNIIHFLTQGKIQIEKDFVKINNNNTEIFLYFDPQAFEVSQDEITLTDKRLSNVWGKRIFRLVFKAKERTLQGKYLFKIKYQ